MREDFEVTMSTLKSICETAPNLQGERVGAFVNDGGQTKVRAGHSHFQVRAFWRRIGWICSRHHFLQRRSGVTESQIPLLPAGDSEF